MSDKGEFLLYIDNSNLFIPNMKKAAELKKNETIPKEQRFFDKITQDWRARIDYGDLVKEMLNGRSLLKKAILYGSTPPTNDSLWKRIEEVGIEVKTSEKNKMNKEKENDTNLVADAIFDMMTVYYTKEKKTRTVIICTGDRDMLPVLKKAKLLNFNVEMWSFDKTSSNKFLVKSDPEYEKPELREFDEIFEKFSWIKTRWSSKRIVPHERAFVLCFETSSDLLFKEIFDSSVHKTTEILQQPTQGMILTGEHYPKHMVIIIVHQANFKGKQNDTHAFVYNFDKDVWSRRPQIQSGIPMCSSVVKYSDFLTKYPEPVTALDDDAALEEEDDGFTTQKGRKSKPICPQGFRCVDETKCGGTHSREEREFFQLHQGDESSRKYYKLRNCDPQRCRHKQESRLCPFIHRSDDIYCKMCRKTGDHFECDCENK